MELGLNEAIIKRESMLGLSQISGCHQNGVKLGAAGSCVQYRYGKGNACVK